MNLSGESVQPAMAFYKVTLPEVICVHDELDLEFGVLRLKVGGGTAGHNGLKSMVQQCGGNDFVRLRMGIAHPMRLPCRFRVGPKRRIDRLQFVGVHRAFAMKSQGTGFRDLRGEGLRVAEQKIPCVNAALAGFGSGQGHGFAGAT